jgi:DNA-binding response OmpR family regulator
LAAVQFETEGVSNYRSIVMSGGKTVLVVEDDEHFRRLVNLALTFAGFEVREARDGIEALRSVDRDPPDLIVLDLSLPGVDGLAVRQEIAAQAITRDVPVVIVTGTDITANLNVACVLRKPVDPDDLVRAVKRCLSGPDPDQGAPLP